MGLHETSIFFQKNHYRHYFLCHYLPLGDGVDTLSRSLLKFKHGRQPDLDAWLDWSVKSLDDLAPRLPAHTIIIRALRHKETRPAPGLPCPLDLLGQSLSRHLHFPYLPGLLQKTRPTTSSQSLTLRERQAELVGVYQINTAALIPAALIPAASRTPDTPIPAGSHTPATPIPPPDAAPSTNPAAAPNTPAQHTPSSLLLIDDILTTGATILSILTALQPTFPSATVNIFTLAKAG